MSPSVSIRRIPALDGLRGAAVGGVLLFHGGHLAGGYLGVDMFFVLSGFLITSLLLAESGRHDRVGLGAFWARRARRLLPALGGLMLGVALYSVAFAAPAELGQIRDDGLATLGYVANWHAVFARQDYWALFGAPSPLQHTWSLAIEEQFYLVWPLVFVGLLAWWKRSTPKAVLVVSTAGAVVSGVLLILLYDPLDTSRAYYGTDTRAAAILIGAAVAAALVVWGPVRSRGARVALEIAAIASVLVLAFSWARIGGQAPTLYRGGLFVCGLATGVIIAAVAHPRSGPLTRALSWRPLCLLGVISYGVYLWHWPVYVVLDVDRTGLAGWPLFGFRVVVTLMIAVVSYVLLEQPIRRGASFKVSWGILAPAAFVVVVALVLTTTSGGEQIASADAQPDLVGAAAREADARPNATRLMLIGDSVAHAIGLGMKEIRTEPGVAVLNQAIPNCTFPYGIRRPLPDGRPAEKLRCDEGWDEAVRRFRPDVVLLVMQCCPGEMQYGGRWIHPCDPAYAAIYRRSFADAVTTLRANGARIAITTAPYSFSEVFHQDDRAGLDCSNVARRATAAARGVPVIDLADWTCPGAPGRVPCRVEQGGVRLRPDRVHFSGEGARIVSRWLLREAGIVGDAPPRGGTAGG